jgi:integrase
MIRRRAKPAGLEGVHAHMFRHTAAHTWLAQGGQEQDMQEGGAEVAAREAAR